MAETNGQRLNVAVDDDMTSDINIKEESGSDNVNTTQDESQLSLDFSNLSREEKQKLQTSISEEFDKLGREYLEARLLRITSLLDSINNSIKTTRSNDKKWQQIFSFEMETINKLKYNVEDLTKIDNDQEIVKNEVLKNFQEYEEELREIFENVQGPLALDDSIKNDEEELHAQLNEDNDIQSNRIVFPYMFEKVFSPFKRALNTLANENVYNTNLIHTSSKAHAKIIWKQYRNDVIRKKQELIQKTTDELSQLNAEYMHLRDNKLTTDSWKQYYRSVIPTDQFISSASRDTTYMNLDNQYLHNNRIEMTNIKRHITEESALFEPQAEDEQGRKRIKLSICAGLSTNEIDADLMSMKQKPSSFPVETTLDAEIADEIVELDEGEVEYEIVNKLVENDKDLDNLNTVKGYDSWSDSSEEDANQLYESDGFDLSEEEDIDEENEEAQIIRDKYKFLLGLNPGGSRSYLPTVLQSTPNFGFKYPMLPPLESFPEINGT